MKPKFTNLQKAVAAVMTRESGVKKSQSILQWSEMFEVSKQELEIAVQNAISLEMNSPKVGKNVPEKIDMEGLNPSVIIDGMNGVTGGMVLGHLG